MLQKLDGLAEQPQHRLVRLVGERQRGGGELLAGLQGQHVRAFAVGIGDDQTVGAGLQRVDHRVGEGLAILHDRQVRAECRCLAANGGQGIGQRRQKGIELRVVLELRVGRRTDSENSAVDAGGSSRLDRQRARIGLVENQLQLIADEQIDAVEARVGGGLVELVAKLIECGDQVCADGIGADCRRADAAVDRRSRDAGNREGG